MRPPTHVIEDALEELIKGETFRSWNLRRQLANQIIRDLEDEGFQIVGCPPGFEVKVEPT